MKKVISILLKVLLVLILIVALLAAGGGVFYAATRSCALTVNIDESEKKQQIYGWGSSACWWSDDISDAKTRTEIAKLLYSSEGLGMNIYRYNVGAGHDTENNIVDNPWRGNESFYVWDEEKEEFVYDFSRDANAQAMLKEALSYGCIDTVILFANSPHYSMCKNGRASGADDGMCNIDESRYEDFADYMFVIAEYFLEQGVPVKYISPINEPQWNWGEGGEAWQEGCHYEKDEVEAVLSVFADKLAKSNLSVELYAPEGANIGDTTKGYYEAMMNNDKIVSTLGAFSYHSYFSDDEYSKKVRFGKWREKNVPSDLRFDMSEWCELPCKHDTQDPESALIMARTISHDVGKTGVNSWTAWVAMNEDGVRDDGINYSDGLLSADPVDATKYTVSYRYYAMQHYSAFVPTGSVMLDCNESVFTPKFVTDTDKAFLTSKLVNTTAYQTPDGKLVVVLVNEGKERDIRFKLNDYSSMKVFTTDNEKKCENTYSGDYMGKVTVGENSIQTFVFEK